MTHTKIILNYKTKNVNLFFSQKPTNFQPQPHYIKHSELPHHNKDGIKIRKEQQN